MTINMERIINKNEAMPKKFKLDLKMFNKVLFFLIVVLFVYYIAGVNDLTVKGFRLQELKRAQKEMEDKNNGLELDIMSLKSHNNLSEKIKKLDMVAVGKIDYISTASGYVAKK